MSQRLRTPHSHRWMLVLAFGAALGALILGGGGRLAMRGITLWERRPHLFSASGTFSVIGFGAAFGVIGAALRLSLGVAAQRWRPAWAPGRVPTVAWSLLCFALAVLMLTPITVHRLVLFLPVVVAYLVAFERWWRRGANSYEWKEPDPVAGPALPSRSA